MSVLMRTAEELGGWSLTGLWDFPHTFRPLFRACGIPFSVVDKYHIQAPVLVTELWEQVKHSVSRTHAHLVPAVTLSVLTDDLFAELLAHPTGEIRAFVVAHRLLELV